MADIAQLGFSADTSALRDAKASIEALVPSAVKAENAAENLGDALTETARDAENAARGISKVEAAARGSVKNVTRVAEGYDLLTGKVNGTFLGISSNLQKLDLIPSKFDKVGKAIKFNATDSLNAVRQFSDIGQTLALGMSPFLVAIQQGPQLLDILQNKAALTGQSIGTVFKAAAAQIWASIAPLLPIFAAVALAVGAVVALFASLNKQANDDSGLKKYTTAMGYTKAEIKKLNAVTVTWGDTFKAVFQVGWERIANAFGISTDNLSKKWNTFLDWMVTATRASAAAVYAALALPINSAIAALDRAKAGKGINPFQDVIDGYKKGYDQAQNFMDDVVKQSRKNARARQDAMAKDMYDKPKAAKGGNKYGFDDLIKDAAKMQNDLTKAQATIGLYGEALARTTYEQDLFNKASEHGLKLNPRQVETIKSLAAAMGTLSEANRTATFRENARQNFLQQWQGLKDASAQIGVYGRDLTALRIEQEMLNKAIAEHITLTENDRDVIRNAAQGLADKEYNNTRDRVAAENARTHAENMRQLDVERNALGLTGKELIAYNYQQELINNALQAGITFKDIDIEKTRKQAEAYAQGRYQLDKTKKALDNAKEGVKSFISEWRSGLEQGKSFISAFADAVISALNRVIDRLLDNSINALFDMIGKKSGGGGGGSGLLGSIGKAIGSLFGGGSSLSSSSIGGAGSYDYSAFKFAKGSSFSNGIASKPTMFAFGHGAGKVGVMGEGAKSEAVMPLTTGPDGSLGVQMYGPDTSASNVFAPQIDARATYVLDGAVSSAEVAAAIRQSGSDVEKRVKRSIPQLLNDYQRNGTI